MIAAKKARRERRAFYGIEPGNVKSGGHALHGPQRLSGSSGGDARAAAIRASARTVHPHDPFEGHVRGNVAEGVPRPLCTAGAGHAAAAVASLASVFLKIFHFAAWVKSAWCRHFYDHLLPDEHRHLSVTSEV
jgi:hypothetical protein